MAGIWSGTVNRVRADVHTPNRVPFHIEDDAQVAFDADRMDGYTVLSRKSVDLMRSQTGVKGVLFKDGKGLLGCRFLLWVKATQGPAK
jgi:hypothetical protein